MFYLPTITGFKQAPNYIRIHIHLWFIPPEKNMAKKLFQKESSLPMNQLIVNQWKTRWESKNETKFYPGKILRALTILKQKM